MTKQGLAAPLVIGAWALVICWSLVLEDWSFREATTWSLVIPHYHPPMHVVIFEGTRWHTFAPLSLSRPVFMLKTGMGTLLDKQVRHLRPTRLSLWVRPEQEPFVRERVVPKLDVPTTVNQP